MSVTGMISDYTSRSTSTQTRQRRQRVRDRYEFLPNHTLVCESHDNSFRWQPGERLYHLFEQRSDDLPSSHLAVVTDQEELTFQEVDARANQLARYLIAQGIRPGDRVALLLCKSAHAYIALLGVLKAKAAFVPLDSGFPPERIAYIASDAEVSAVLTVSSHEALVADLPVPTLCLDRVDDELRALDDHRLSDAEVGESFDELAYIIYTSGSTGNPKGVAIDHASICNFVRVAAEVYGIQEDDRMYQGMTLAFDFSVEEIWVPWMAGATLVPGPASSNLVGQDLADYIRSRNITALCCVPTLLATLEDDLPQLRFVLASGEACPQDLVRRWARPGRILLNAYGPTEATVTATLTELYPGKPVTIGGPLPTYTVLIMPEDQLEALPRGEVGEICVAGIGLARGYVNRQDLTDKAFVPDFLALGNNPPKRIYRTGDLGRINEDNEIEYLGRIDTQVKVRGYRIELTEIESVLMQVPQIAQAVVDVYQPEPNTKELIAYYTLREGHSEPTDEEIVQVLREHLPAYMVPAYLEPLAIIPMLPSHKADRKKLPPPSRPRLSCVGVEYVAPEGTMEETLAGLLGDVMGTDKVSVTAHFFQELGAHSLLMAKFSARVRDELPGVELAMQDIYQRPTVRLLAEHLQAHPVSDVRVETHAPVHQATNTQHFFCGLGQLLFYVAFYIPLLVVGIEALNWILRSAHVVDAFLRGVATTGVFFVAFAAFPLLARKLLIGRWTARSIKLWSLDYYRFWIVNTLQRSNPLLLFRGTPLYNVYLRLLGAHIGKNVLNFSRHVPLNTDLLSIGDDTVIQKDTVLLGYKAEHGYLHVGPITIGREVYIGEGSFVDIHTEIGDRSQLGHTSTLPAHQSIPAGKRYHGSPAEETTANYRRVAPLPCSTLRKVVYCGVQVLFALVVPALTLAAAFALFPALFGAHVSLATLSAQASGLRSLFAWDVLLLTLGLFVTSLVVGLAVVLLVPRLLNRFLQPDREYVLFGFHYVLFRWIQGLTNNQFFKTLFGDSSIKPHYFRWLGWKLGSFKQTGSNFGLQERHDNPFLCEIGHGTMVSDGLSLINADYSSSSFKLSPTQIGKNCFIGNDIHFPPNARVGDNCLFASKVMLPVDGPVREGVGLLGSPPFEIPRNSFEDLGVTADELEQQRVAQLPHKNRANAWTLSTFLFVRWFFLYTVLMGGYLAFVAYHHYGVLAFAASTVALTAYGIGFLALIERMTLRFRPMQPTTCTIYDPAFWRVEHYWKHCENGLISLFKGTPFKPMISRLLGMKVGRRVFDDGFQSSERTMVTIGDDAILNEGAFLQCHSLEDGFFKSDRIQVGDGCTVGVKTYVHYGTEMRDGSVLAADSFLMKGEVVDASTLWQGNPARFTALLKEEDSTPPTTKEHTAPQLTVYNNPQD